MPRFQSYATSKGAVQPLIRSIVAEHSRHGIRANMIQPGFIETEMSGHFRESTKVNDAILRRIPQRRWGTAADFGGIAVYFASDASAYHSGDTVVIDGGYLVS
jgi:NAD(P)-dependent dehydrogenase (short-subunit alcohol dehydrogenase family)